MANNSFNLSVTVNTTATTIITTSNKNYNYNVGVDNSNNNNNNTKNVAITPMPQENNETDRIFDTTSFAMTPLDGSSITPTVGIENGTTSKTGSFGNQVIQLIPIILVIVGLLTFVILALNRRRQRRSAKRRAQSDYLDYYHANRPFSTIYGIHKQNTRSRHMSIGVFRTRSLRLACNSTALLIAEISGLYSTTAAGGNVSDTDKDETDVTESNICSNSLHSKSPIVEATDTTMETSAMWIPDQPDTTTPQYAASITNAIVPAPNRFNCPSLHPLAT